MFSHDCDLTVFLSLSPQLHRDQRKERPLMRRKSELPQDTSMMKALETHRRAEDMIGTQDSH